MKIVRLDHPLTADLLTQLRDQATPPPQFRAAVRKLSILLFYEASRDLRTQSVVVETPLARAQGVRIRETIGLIPILRAGLGMVEGILELVPDAQVWHLGLYRDEETLEAISYYNKLSGSEPVETAFVLDPMIATGGTVSAAVGALRGWGVQRIKLLGIIASEAGLQHIEHADPELEVYVCAVDPQLDERGFIVPGLGDAGDRQFRTA